MIEKWKPMLDAPRDGSLITVRMPKWEARVYWDDELRTWVLTSPRHLESIARPEGWRK
jgi:hypothetical protein